LVPVTVVHMGAIKLLLPFINAFLCMYLLTLFNIYI